jgi:chemotaxis protein methyltransferase CheR
LGERNVRILGTDISESCLKSGATGIYSSDVVDRQVPPALIKKYFLRGVGEKSSEYYKFDPSFANQLKWRPFNLVSSELGSKVMFDFIFLRNVLIYFDAESGYQIAKKLINYLKPGGHFIIGLSETVMNPEDLGLKRVENSVYRKG